MRPRLRPALIVRFIEWTMLQIFTKYFYYLLFLPPPKKCRSLGTGAYRPRYATPLSVSKAPWRAPLAAAAPLGPGLMGL